MHALANTAPAGQTQEREENPGQMLALSWKQALPLALGAVVAFHLAYTHPRLGFLVVLYLGCLFQLTALPTPRKAFYFGLLIGYAVYAPQLAFFWTIFG